MLVGGGGGERKGVRWWEVREIEVDAGDGKVEGWRYVWMWIAVVGGRCC